MVDIVVVYDDLDLGTNESPGLDYFYCACAIDFISNILGGYDGFSVQEIDGEKLSFKKINETLDSRKNPCLFVAFSHGIEEALLYNGQKDYYLKSGTNHNKLNGCIFYTWSCLSGKVLANDIYKNGCLATFGYEDDVWAGTFEMESFISGANSGLRSLFEGNKLDNVIQDMYKRYCELIDYYNEVVHDFFMANLLRKNRDALIVNGDKKFCLNDISY